MKKALRALLVISFVLTALAPVQARQYTMREISASGGDVHAGAINNSGEVVGSASFADGPHMIYWDAGGAPLDLGPGFIHSLNNKGQTVISLSGVGAFIRNRDGSTIPLTSQVLWSPRALNDLGHVAGSERMEREHRAVFWSPETGMVDVGILPGDVRSESLCINNSDQIAGISRNSAWERHPFIWTMASGIRPLPMESWMSEASVRVINEQGQVLGIGYPEHGIFHHVIWNPDGSIMNLGYIGVQDFNNVGQVVAIMSPGPGAWVRDADGSAHELPKWPGTDLVYPFDINDNGSVLGECMGPNGVHVVVWDPIVPVIADMVIEPGTLNPKSNGKWVTCYIELPADAKLTLQDIDLASIKLQGSLSPAMSPTSIGDVDGDGVPDLMLKFDRASLCNALSVGTQAVKLAGVLTGGTDLIGECNVRVLGK